MSEEFADAAVKRRVVRSTPRFTGHVWSVRTDLVQLGDSDGDEQVERDVLTHPGAVGIIAVDEQLRVLFVRQYRHPVGALLWEPPAGLLDVDGEDPLDAAARELFEEAGYRARTWSVLVDAFSSPGGSDEAVRIYLARDLTEVDGDERHVGEGEERDMPTRWLPLHEARDAVLSGRLHNPLAVMGILSAAHVLLGDSPVAPPRPARAPWLRSNSRLR
ncbi:MAG TPA: NUDIX hydrolase [Acidothermaceae bacterium]|nr:NUDIX hydrolase [Acidothermaceae bacterium]